VSKIGAYPDVESEGSWNADLDTLTAARCMEVADLLQASPQ